MKTVVYQLQRCVRGYHICMEEWEADVGEEAQCKTEEKNVKDPYAVAVVCKMLLAAICM